MQVFTTIELVVYILCTTATRFDRPVKEVGQQTLRPSYIPITGDLIIQTYMLSRSSYRAVLVILSPLIGSACLQRILKTIATSRTLPKTRLSGLHFCCRKYGSIFTQFNVTLEWNAFSVITQNNRHYAVQGNSRSLILVPMEILYATSY